MLHLNKTDIDPNNQREKTQFAKINQTMEAKSRRFTTSEYSIEIRKPELEPISQNPETIRHHKSDQKKE